jgi:soluble lytic murein transglycosylase-like protein
VSTASASLGSTPYDALFAAAGARHGIDPRILSAVARVESNYDPNAVSSAGARGLMQFMPATAAGMGIDPLDPAQAIDGAARYLTTQMRDFGSLELALAAYNAGPGAVRRHGGIPPYAQTQNYVAKVMSILNGAPS